MSFADSNINKIIYVDDDNTIGPWEGTVEHPYQYIQDGIDVSYNGDKVYVYNGTYQEKITINKKINIQGNNPNSTIIDGQYDAIVVNIISDWVNINGFTILHSGFSPYHPYPGIYINHVKNCNVSENIIESNWHGIFINFSSNCIISRNIINDSYESGIYISNSSNISVFKNKFYTRAEGIIIKDSSYLKINNNTFIKNGITLRGSIISHWNTHNILDNNKDGNPIHYFKNNYNTVVPSDAGQIILANCTNIKIQYLTFRTKNTYLGYQDGPIQLGFSSNISIRYNDISINSREASIYMYSCINSNISDNILDTSNGRGIELSYSKNNSIFNNSITNNNYGITFSYSNYNIIKDNKISNSYRYGINMKYSSFNIFNRNNISNNFHGGISIYNSSENIISENNISNNFHFSLLIEDSNRDKIVKNTFSFNGGFILYDSSFVSIINNIFHSEGIIITGESVLVGELIGSVKYWNTHTIEQNYIDGKIIQYLANVKDCNVSKNAGQVILANTSNIQIEGLNISGIKCPIQIGFSNNNLINNNMIDDAEHFGILLFNSDENIVSNNILYENGVGIELDLSLNNIIEDNILMNNYFGIFLYFSEKISIQRNNFQFNEIQADYYIRVGRDNLFRINKWSNNYWSDWIGLGPKIISGTHYPRYLSTGYWWPNFDWHPHFLR